MVLIRQTLAVMLLNLRTIPARLGSSSVAIIGIAGVVVVFVSVLSISAGSLTRAAIGSILSDRATDSNGPMKNDPSFIFKASTQASRAVDFVLTFSRTPEPEEALAE